MKRARHQRGSVVLNRSRKVWYYLYFENGSRRTKTIGSLSAFRTKSAAWDQVASLSPISKPSSAIAVKTLIEHYRLERMPARFSTRYGYESWIKNHILPKWGDSLITELQPREVELWLRSLELGSKSRIHIRGVIHQLWEFAMWRADVPTQRNPMQLVKITESTKRRKPRSLKEDEFHKFLVHLEEPIRTVALVCVSFGLRISECLALKWSDLDWLSRTLQIVRGIVRQRVGPVKTKESEQKMSVDAELLAIFKNWKQITQFSAESDWMFASPVKLGRQPISYPYVWLCFQAASRAAGIPQFGTHSLRHTYRSWLDANGTPIAVQQKLMRHTDIRTTMNLYGDVVSDQMRDAQSKVARVVLRGLN